MNVQKLVRDYDFSKVQLSPAQRASFDLGEDMIRIPFDAKLRIEVPEEDLLAQQHENNFKWLKVCGVAQEFLQAPAKYFLANDPLTLAWYHTTILLFWAQSFLC